MQLRTLIQYLLDEPSITTKISGDDRAFPKHQLCRITSETLTSLQWFTNAMYQIGGNAILLALHLQARSFITTESRLFLIRSELVVIKTNRVNEWRINKTRILSDIFDWEDSVINIYHD